MCQKILKLTLSGLYATLTSGRQTTTRATLINHVLKIFSSLMVLNMSYWLQKYVLGTRKKTGEKYPPKTVYLLLCGLNRYMKEKRLNSFNIFNRDNPDFKLLFNTCDNLFRELRESHGSESKATEPITKEDEEKLWSTGVLSLSTPQGLLNAVFFLNGKSFALRGGAEHQCLKLSQITRNILPESKVHVRWETTYNSSKISTLSSLGR